MLINTKATFPLFLPGVRHEVDDDGPLRRDDDHHGGLLLALVEQRGRGGG